MSSNNYPYPVLMQKACENDSVIVTTDPIVEEELSQNDFDFVVSAKFSFDDDYIKSLIAEGKAAYCAIVKCSSTSFSYSKLEQLPHVNFTISRLDVREKVTIEYFAVLLERIIYENPNRHPDFIGYDIEMTPGDILVDFGSTQFNADVIYNRYATSEGIFSIVKSDTAKFMEVNTSNSKKIIITLPPRLYDFYDQYKQGKTSLFDCIIAIPVLIQALNAIDFDNPESNTQSWADSILETIRLNPDCKDLVTSNTDKSRIPELAQALFKNPFVRFFNDFKNAE